MSAATVERPAVAPHQDPALAGRDDVRPTGRRLGPGRRRRLAWLLGPSALLLLWTAASATGLLDPRILSEPWTVVATAGELIADGRLQENLVISAQRAGLGLFFGIVVGALLALVAGLSRHLNLFRDAGNRHRDVQFQDLSERKLDVLDLGGFEAGKACRHLVHTW